MFETIFESQILIIIWLFDPFCAYGSCLRRFVPLTFAYMNKENFTFSSSVLFLQPFFPATVYFSTFRLHWKKKWTPRTIFATIVLNWFDYLCSSSKELLMFEVRIRFVLINRPFIPSGFENSIFRPFNVLFLCNFVFFFLTFCPFTFYFFYLVCLRFLKTWLIFFSAKKSFPLLIFIVCFLLLPTNHGKSISFW